MKRGLSSPLFAFPGYACGMTEDNFEQNVRRILGEVGDLLVERNREYGNSALDPIGVFSKASREDQLATQLDHKLSRVARGGDPSNDTLRDIAGYVTLMLIAREGA